MYGADGRIQQKLCEQQAKQALHREQGHGYSDGNIAQADKE
jgi:hypothetical protein